MSFERYTGRMYEADALGAVALTPAYQTRLRELARGRTAQGGDPYVSFEEGVRLAKEFQPWDPTNPEKEFSRELRLAVIETLNIPEDQLDRVRVYTTVGTPLDQLHRVDAFLEMDDPTSRQPLRVTIDLTRNPMKASEHGGIVETESLTHLIVGELPEPEHPGFLPLVAEVAAAAAESLRRQRPSSARSPARYAPPPPSP